MSGHRHFGLRSTAANSKFDEREIAAWVFAALCAVVPFAAFAFLLSVHRLFLWLVAS